MFNCVGLKGAIVIYITIFALLVREGLIKLHKLNLDGRTCK